MKQYKIFQHPAGEVEAVKQGWSWPAFFFGWIWALVKKIWVLGVCVLALFLVLLIVSAAAETDAIFIIINLISIGVGVIFGVKGNSWREKNLSSRGYEYKDTLTAANPEGALALFLKEHTLAGEGLAS